MQINSEWNYCENSRRLLERLEDSSVFDIYINYLLNLYLLFYI